MTAQPQKYTGDRECAYCPWPATWTVPVAGGRDHVCALHAEVLTGRAR